MIVKTANLILIPCDIETLNAAIQGNENLAKKLNVNVQDNWTEFGVAPLKYSISRLKESEEEKIGGLISPFTNRTTRLLVVVGIKANRQLKALLKSDMKLHTNTETAGLQLN